jgi:hypothetical protein
MRRRNRNDSSGEEAAGGAAFGRCIFPKEDVERCRRATGIGRRPVSEDFWEQASEMEECPGCRKPPEQQEWFFFKSPAWTWKKLCGRAGWMSYCARCDNQVNFVPRLMS